MKVTFIIEHDDGQVHTWQLPNAERPVMVPKILTVPGGPDCVEAFDVSVRGLHSDEHGFAMAQWIGGETPAYPITLAP